MAILPQWFGLPRPQSFLYLISLRTGTEMISLTMIFNKLTGFYGFLAVFAGLQLSATQLSMYIYSVIALVVLALLTPHIRKRSPMQCLALAWFYTFDTLLNCVYTTIFACTWFLTISAVQSDKNGMVGGAPGSGTIADTAGFTDPEFLPVASVIVDVDSTTGLLGEEAVAYGIAAAASAVTGDPSVEHGVGLAESVPSVIIVVILTLIRMYFILIVMSYARQVLREHMASAASARAAMSIDGEPDEEMLNPFAKNTANGHGWQGTLGRIMVSVGRGYWLGNPGDSDWAKMMAKKFKGPKHVTPNEPRGTFERERRARSGTGPPAPLPDMTDLPK